MGVDLLYFGFDSFFQDFLSEISPKMLLLIGSSNPAFAGEKWKIFHAFVIRYDANKPGETSHPKHYDDSDVTLNFCLGGNFKGGALRVYDGANYVDYVQEPGQLFIHPGNLLHSANKISCGERFNLVIWLKRSIDVISDSAAHIFDLPEEVLVHILSYLDVKNICMLTRVNSTFRRLCKDNSMWSRLYNQFVLPVREVFQYGIPIAGGDALPDFWYSTFHRSRRDENSSLRRKI